LSLEIGAGWPDFAEKASSVGNSGSSFNDPPFYHELPKFSGMVMQRLDRLAVEEASAKHSKCRPSEYYVRASSPYST
jgi:hypothetical protein